MTAVSTLQNISITQIGPFFPIEAANKGVKEMYIGLIISCMPIFYLIGSLTMAKKLQSIGNRCALRLGLCMIVV